MVGDCSRPYGSFAVVRHIADPISGDAFCHCRCMAFQGVSSQRGVSSAVGFCVRCATFALWAAPWPGVGSVSDTFIEVALDAFVRLGVVV